MVKTFTFYMVAILVILWIFGHLYIYKHYRIIEHLVVDWQGSEASRLQAVFQGLECLMEVDIDGQILVPIFVRIWLN